MEPNLDVNKIAAEFLQSHLDDGWAILTSGAKGARNWVRSKFERTYRNYLERILNQYSRESFFVRSEPMPIYSFFVPLDLATQLRKLPKASATDVAKVATHSIIIGSGGSGKTTMMRHLLLSTIMERAKTPIFLELRQVNQDGDRLRSVLLRTLQLNGLDIEGQLGCWSTARLSHHRANHKTTPRKPSKLARGNPGHAWPDKTP